MNFPKPGTVEEKYVYDMIIHSMGFSALLRDSLDCDCVTYITLT